MMLLRRAPREVYRLYDEQTFLDNDTGEKTVTAGGHPLSRLRRLAGATMLLGAVGVVGGIFLVHEQLPVNGSGRRLGVRLRSASNLPTAARVGPAENQSLRPAEAGRSGATRGRARLVHDNRVRARARAVLESGLPGKGAGIPAHTTEHVERFTAGVPPLPRRAGRAEFGFER
jgi:hypothetical protein